MDGNVYKADFIQQKIQYVESRYAWCHALDSLPAALGGFQNRIGPPFGCCRRGDRTKFV